MVQFAYFHGYASSPLSRKGVYLAERLESQGVTLHRPDLNQPSLSEQSFEKIFEFLDKFDATHCNPLEKWRIIGSSMGGFIAAAWAERRPERVDRLLLLCPGFNMKNRWRALLGASVMDHWKESGWLTRPDGAGVMTKIHYKNVEELETLPAFPKAACPCHIIHGRSDETVPFESSEGYCQENPELTLIPVDDDHSLMKSLSMIEQETLEFLGASKE